MTWAGTLVEEALGVRVGPRDARRFRLLAGLAARRNARRAHLIVSTVLGKHVPARPSDVLGAGHELGALVGAALGSIEPSRLLVIGFAETATALGHQVADTLEGSRYLHSTRRPGPAPLVEFSEDHSHATAHYLDPSDPQWLASPAAVVLVDDELSTGRTAMNIIEALIPVTACRVFVLASLIDSRDPAERDRTREQAARLGVTVRDVALVHPRISVPDDAVESAARLLRSAAVRPRGQSVPGSTARMQRLTVPGPLDGRGGLSADERRAMTAYAGDVAGTVRASLPGEPGPVIVIGIEEFMAFPILVAHALELSGLEVACMSTTRSPVVAIDEDGYAIRSARVFDDPAGQERYLYNLPGVARAFVVIGPPDAAGGLVETLLATGGAVHVVEVAST